MTPTATNHELSNGELRAPVDDESPPTPHNSLLQVPDAELIRRFVTVRDEVAFGELVRRYSPLVLSVALRTVHDRPSAEDVLQATFLVLVEKAASLDDPSQVSAWLHGVAQRISRRLVDKRHRHRERPYREESVIMDPGAVIDPFERVSETRDHDILGEELQRLPAKYRTPLVLRYLDDLTNEQVAERLGMKVSTLEGRLKRGKKELRRRLARRGVTLGAALLVWNMTRQVVEAAPVADLATSITTTALGWQNASSTVPPPPESAVTLAQQELLSMSALKLTTASTLVGTTLLATGLLVTMANAQDDPTVGAAATSTVGEIIETSIDPDSDRQGDGSTPLPVDQGAGPLKEIKVFELKHADAESAAGLLSELFESGGGPFAGVRGDTSSPKFSFHARTNSVIAAGEKSQLEVVEAILMRLDRPDELGVAATPAADPFAQPAAADPSGANPLLAAGAIPPVDDEDSFGEFRLHGSIRGRIFKLQHADAESVYTLLNGMISEDARDIAGIPSEGQIWLSFDARTNSIIAAGDKSKMAALEGMLWKLDEQLKTGSGGRDTGAVNNTLLETPGAPGAAVDPRHVVVFPLEFVDATETLKTLDAIYPSAATVINGRPADDPARLRLVVDARKNMIIAYGTEQEIRKIEDLIQIIDSPDPQRLKRPKPLPAVADSRPQDADGSVSPFDLTKRSPAERRLRDILKNPTVPAFDEHSLDQVLFLLAEEHGFQYFIDRDALDDAGIMIDETSVTLNLQNAPELRHDVSVESALELALRQASQSAGGFGESALAYFVRQGLLIVTTRDVAEETMEVRTYDLRPFNDDAIHIQGGAVIEAIRTMAGDMTWSEQGGRGSLVAGVNTLTVRQSPLAHREIEKLLEQMLHAANQTRQPAE